MQTKKKRKKKKMNVLLETYDFTIQEKNSVLSNHCWQLLLPLGKYFIPNLVLSLEYIWGGGKKKIERAKYKNFFD